MTGILISIDVQLTPGSNRPEDSTRTLLLYFIPLSLFYFAIVGGESTYYTNIFSYATCAANLPPSDSGEGFFVLVEKRTHRKVTKIFHKIAFRKNFPKRF